MKTDFGIKVKYICYAGLIIGIFIPYIAVRLALHIFLVTYGEPHWRYEFITSPFSPNWFKFYFLSILPFLFLFFIAKSILPDINVSREIFMRRAVGIFSAFLTIILSQLAYSIYLAKFGILYEMGGLELAPLVPLLAMPVGYCLGYIIARIMIIIREGLP